MEFWQVFGLIAITNLLMAMGLHRGKIESDRNNVGND